MATYIEEFVAKLGFEVDGKAIKGFEERTESLKKTFQSIGKYASLAAGAITGVVAVANRGTAKVDALAQSVGASTENIFALSNALKPLGFEVDNVVDLVEEMNNKFGESTGLGEQMTAVREATQILGVEFDNIRKLAPEEQFLQILDAALALEDTQQAVSAVDMLTGGEGNKIVGFLRAQGKGIREVIEEQKRLNLLTEDGIEGAKKFDAAFLKLTTVGQSLVQQFSGKLGDVLGPIIDDLVEWIIVNEDLIQSELTKWAKDVGEFLVFIFETVRDLVTGTLSLIERIGGLRVAFRILLVVMGGILALKFGLWIHSMVIAVKALVVGMGGLTGVLTALKIAALGLKWLLIFGLLALIIEDIVGFLSGKDSVVGDMSKEFENLLEAANEYWAEVFNMDPEEFRRNVVGFLEQEWTAYFRDAGLWWEEFFSDLWRTISDFFGQVFTDAGSWWSELFSDWGNSIAEFFSSAWNRFAGFWTSVFEAVVGYVTGIRDYVAGIFSQIGEFFTGLGGSIFGFFSGIAESIRGIYDEVVNWVMNKIDALVDVLPDSAKEFLGLPTEGGSVRGARTPRTAPVTNVAANLGGGAGRFAAAAAGAGNGSTTTVGPTFNITVPTNLAVSQKGSMSPEELSRKVSSAISTEVSKAVRNNSEGVAY